MATMTMKEMMKVMMEKQEVMMEKMETLDKRVSALEESGRTSSSEKKKATSKTKTTKKTTKTKTPATRKEAISAWKAEKGIPEYSDEERKAYGKACREVREALRQKAEKDGYLSKAAYKKAANKMMADKGFGPMYR